MIKKINGADDDAVVEPFPLKIVSQVYNVWTTSYVGRGTCGLFFLLQDIKLS